MDAYELGFVARLAAQRAGGETRVLLVTAEESPVDALGPAASEAIGDELARAGIELITGVEVRQPGHHDERGGDALTSVMPRFERGGHGPGEDHVVLHLEPGSPLVVDRALHLPAIHGPAMPRGGPRRPRVPAGATATPAPSMTPASTRLATPPRSRSSTARSRRARPRAAAEAIAAEAGADVTPAPWSTVLYGMLTLPPHYPGARGSPWLADRGAGHALRVVAARACGRSPPRPLPCRARPGGQARPRMASQRPTGRGAGGPRRGFRDPWADGRSLRRGPTPRLSHPPAPGHPPGRARRRASQPRPGAGARRRRAPRAGGRREAGGGRLPKARGLQPGRSRARSSWARHSAARSTSGDRHPPAAKPRPSIPNTSSRLGSTAQDTPSSIASATPRACVDPRAARPRRPDVGSVDAVDGAGPRTGLDRVHEDHLVLARPRRR